MKKETRQTLLTTHGTPWATICEETDFLTGELMAYNVGEAARYVGHLTPSEFKQLCTEERGGLVGISNANMFNHGCVNYAVAERVSRFSLDVYRVIEARSCHSCWQVGHDQDYVFLEVGDLVRITDKEFVGDSSDWPTDITWSAADFKLEAR